MERTVSRSPHRIANPSQLAPPVGFAHAVVAAPGTPVFLGGQTALDATGTVRGTTFAEQVDVAAGNVATALAAVGAKPEHLVWMQIYVTDMAGYRTELADVGRAYRRHLGSHYPAMALVEVPRLFDVEALVELVGVAVLPARDAPGDRAAPGAS